MRAISSFGAKYGIWLSAVTLVMNFILFRLYVQPFAYNLVFESMERTQKPILNHFELRICFAIKSYVFDSECVFLFIFVITSLKQNTQIKYKQIICLPQSPAADHRWYFADVWCSLRALCFVPTAFYQVLLPVANLSELKAHKLFNLDIRFVLSLSLITLRQYWMQNSWTMWEHCLNFFHFRLISLNRPFTFIKRIK